MILSSFDFQRKVDFVLHVCNEIDIFEETNFSMFSCLGFMFQGFCSPMRSGIVRFFCFAY